MITIARAARAARAGRAELSARAFDMPTIARLAQRRHVLCVGDSHVLVFDHVRVAGVWFKAFTVEGATASGIMNPHSVTRAFPLLRERLDRAPRWQHVVVCLGEVDCGFVIWHRAQRHGLSIDEQLETTLNSYVAFLRAIKEASFASLSVLSAPLPTITDDSSVRGEVANLRRHVTATQRQRTGLTRRFNERLRRRVAGEGVGFIDATSGQLDARTEVIDRRLIRDGGDHHLRDEPYAALIADAWIEHARAEASPADGPSVESLQRRVQIEPLGQPHLPLVLLDPAPDLPD